jgi:hypothetical protein
MNYSDFTDEELNMLARKAVEIELYKKKLRKEPIAIYDREKGEAVLVYPNGERDVMKRLRKGHYSERVKNKEKPD